MPRDLAVFDLDGTLVDSAADLGAALNLALGARGRRALAVHEVRGMVGNGARMLVRRGFAATGAAAGEAELDAALAHFLDVYLRAPAVHTRAYPGAVEALAALAAAGWRLALCTNKPVAHSHAILDALGLARFFPVVVGGDSLPAKKPDPAPLLLAIAQVGGRPEQAVMVGDSPTDVGAARAAGVPVVAVSFGYRRVGLEDLGADAVVDTLAQLPEALAAIG